jgi:hypothetical protein
MSYPSGAASLPVALRPWCAATTNSSPAATCSRRQRGGGRLHSRCRPPAMTTVVRMGHLDLLKEREWGAPFVGEYGGSGGGSGYGAGAGRTGEARRVAAASTAASRDGLLITVRSHLCVFFFPLVFLKSYPLILDLTMRLYFTLRLSHHSPFVLQQKNA